MHLRVLLFLCLFLHIVTSACGRISANSRNSKNTPASADQIVVDPNGTTKTGGNQQSLLNWDGKSFSGNATYEIIATE